MSVPSTASIADSRFATTSTAFKVAELVGRIMLAALFLISGFGKLTAYGATAAYMSSLGVPGVLLPLVVATEVLGGIAIIIGWKTRIVAFLMAGFTLLTGLVFHSNFADQNQAIHFMKNVSIAGAFMLLVCNGAGPLSLDHRRRK
jgi:putative oxidoreductase